MKPTLKENEKQALKELKARLQALYGSRLKGAFLFGSKARGEATDESDIDVIAVIDGLDNPRRDRRKIIAETSTIDLAHNVFISVQPVDAEFYAHATNMPFYATVKAEGIPL